jgi:hypothetical protein
MLRMERYGLPRGGSAAASFYPATKRAILYAWAVCKANGAELINGHYVRIPFDALVIVVLFDLHRIVIDAREVML